MANQQASTTGNLITVLVVSPLIGVILGGPLASIGYYLGFQSREALATVMISTGVLAFAWGLWDHVVKPVVQMNRA